MPDDYQREMLGARLADAIQADERWGLLAESLLGWRGELIAVTYEPNLDELVTRGRPFTPSGVVPSPGDRSRCHLNVARLYKNNAKKRPCTGWVLNDGIWRQHSWAIQGSTIIETTERRELYWGYKLTTKEARALVAGLL